VDVTDDARISAAAPVPRRGPFDRWAALTAIAVAAGFDGWLGAGLGLRVADAVAFGIAVGGFARLPVALVTLAVAIATVNLAAGLTPVEACAAAALGALYVGGLVAVWRRVRPGGNRVEDADGFVLLVAVAIFGGPAVAGLTAQALTAAGVPTAVTAALDWPGRLLGATLAAPVLLVQGRDQRDDRFGLRRPGVLAAMAVLVGGIGWSAASWFPYPFVVAGVPLLVAAARVPAAATALLGAGCMIEMALITRAGAGGREVLPFAAVSAAAALTGLMPTAFALLLAELRAERARLATSGAAVRRILASIQGHGFCALDGDGIVTEWNDKAGRMTGFSAGDVVGRSFAFFFTAEDRAAGLPAALIADARLTGRADWTGWRLRADGSRFWAQVTLEAHPAPHGGAAGPGSGASSGGGLGGGTAPAATGFIETLRDQSELRATQTALIREQRRLGFALGSAGQGVWERDLAADRLVCSDACLAMLGLGRDDLGERPNALAERIHPDDAARLVGRLDPDEGIAEHEYRIRHGDGRWIWVLDRRQVAERDEAGRPVSIIGVLTDITARHLAEEKFRLAVEASPNGLMIVDGAGRITLANRETERMFGVAPGALIGRPVEDLLPEAERAGHDRHRATFAAAPSTRRMGGGRELSGLRSDGQLFPIEIGLNPIATTEGMQALCVITDITDRKRAAVELAVSEARYRMMADHLIDLVVHLDLDFRRIWVSPAARDILGYEPDDLVGQTPASNTHPDDAETVWTALRDARAGRPVRTLHARYRHRDGRWIWLAVSLRLMHDDRNAPIGILAVARDVTLTRAAEEALKANEATFRGAMEGASIGMVIEDLDGRWVSTNPALRSLLGHVGKPRNTHPFGRVHPDDAGNDTELRQRLIAGDIPSYQVEKRWIHRSGRVVWTHQSVSLARGPDGQPRHLILQIQDITDRKQVERMKSEFISIVSHELRTPLTSIRGALGLVLGAMRDSVPGNVLQLIDIAHKNSERLIPLVNDILDLDKLDAGKMRFDITEADAGQLVRQAVEATTAFAERFGVAFRLELPGVVVPVRADEGRFIQIVTNLLSNAAKFSPRDSSVVVSVVRSGGMVRVSVADQGPGIPEEFRGRIFGRFAQADSATSRKAGGSGLGLHICRQFVELMDGRIDFDSRVGAGATFWFELPAPEPTEAADDDRPAEPAAAAVGGGTAPRRPRILHVEDDADFAEVLASGLGRHADVVRADRIATALDRLAETTFDLVLIDPDLPDGNGLKALMPKIDRSRTAVVVLSAGEAAEAHNSAVLHLVKSRLSETQLLETILGYLAQQSVG
jgi:PAS domain S-box-containing protein